MDERPQTSAWDNLHTVRAQMVALRDSAAASIRAIDDWFRTCEEQGLG